MIGALKADPDMLALVRAAKARGLTVRAMLGWEPNRTITPTGDGSYTITTAPAWDETERNMALALDEIEAHTCHGCGSDLTETLTDKSPLEDDGDGYYHRIHVGWCRGCVAMARWQQRVSSEDRELEGTSADPLPQARRIRLERLPIPTED
ncbi:hypothetical protein ACTQ29_08395 [Bifidobacterium boum]